MPLVMQSPILIAGEDIFVYKVVIVVNKQVRSPYEDFYWEPGKVYRTGLKIIYGNLIEVGFHGYLKKHKVIDGPEIPDFRYAIMKIPIGSRYVHGILDHIVSDSMALDFLLYEKD
jgi:hypothetical protein